MIESPRELGARVQRAPGRHVMDKMVSVIEHMPAKALKGKGVIWSSRALTGKQMHG